MIPENVLITNRLENTLSAFLQSIVFSQVGVLVDENTRQHCYPHLRFSLPSHHLIQIQSGELHKNLDTCAHIWQEMTNAGFDRKALWINLGGGVIGDMGGFCASTYKRGINFINIPTTLLAQVDAAVGGKLGIDFQGFKNHIGLFKDPLSVIISSAFLETLSQRELRSGFAEVIKHSLIADHNYWPKITNHSFKDQDWESHITHSVKVKATVVSQDFKENGLRKILNFGHTIGHAVESYFLNTPSQLLHGEAIAIGMVSELYLSQKYAHLSLEELTEAEKYLLDVYGYVALDAAQIEQIASLAIQDKKNEKSIIYCTLLKKIGAAVYDIKVEVKDIEEALNYYQNKG
jgi:3-dehydroquinate synthase